MQKQPYIFFLDINMECKCKHTRTKKQVPPQGDIADLIGKVKEEGGRVMGSKCAVVNLGQSLLGFFLSVWSSVMVWC